MAVHARLTYLQKQDITNSDLTKYTRQHELDQFDLLWKKEEFYEHVTVEDFPFSTEMRSRYQKRYALDLNEESDNVIDDGFFSDEDVIPRPFKRRRGSEHAFTDLKASSSNDEGVLSLLVLEEPAVSDDEIFDGQGTRSGEVELISSGDATESAVEEGVA